MFQVSVPTAIIVSKNEQRRMENETIQVGTMVSQRDLLNLLPSTDGMYSKDPFESEKFLIQVECPWTSGGDGNNIMLWNKQRPQALQSRREKPRPLLGMKKVLQTKFRVPKRIQTVHPWEKQGRVRRKTWINKRSQPMYPGELEQQFYSSGGGHQRYPGHGGGRGRLHDGGKLREQ